MKIGGNRVKRGNRNEKYNGMRNECLIIIPILYRARFSK